MAFTIAILIASLIPAVCVYFALGHVMRPDYRLFGGPKELATPKPNACTHCGVIVARDPDKCLCPHCKKMIH
ncbi:hypothetical protein [Alkalihalobacillus sp. LMS39]|uniref:hypothetical protein n=1 Tax=Alkalihalobacillus sp. LMS39 TaxID=2924032 RepID=UPI001FB28F90|nr:hypothetical protein [Alkalihalobacillus sp. LMS39]UOE92090.1 hypothetical protein MM271_12510 [Alkalihalobacillus sp. LMS39]